MWLRRIGDHPSSSPARDALQQFSKKPNRDLRKSGHAFAIQSGASNVLLNSSIMNTDFDRQQLAREAKAIVALALRNGPIENIHAGRPCPTCTGQAGYSRITDAEMKLIMKNAVDHVYALLSLKNEEPGKYESQIRLGERYTATWDEPSMPEGRKRELNW